MQSKLRKFAVIGILTAAILSMGCQEFKARGQLDVASTMVLTNTWGQQVAITSGEALFEGNYNPDNGKGEVNLLKQGHKFQFPFSKSNITRMDKNHVAVTVDSQKDNVRLILNQERAERSRQRVLYTRSCTYTCNRYPRQSPRVCHGEEVYEGDRVVYAYSTAVHFASLNTQATLADLSNDESRIEVENERRISRCR